MPTLSRIRGLRVDQAANSSYPPFRICGALTLHGQGVRMAYMDVPPAGPANGHSVVLLHGNNLSGFYVGGPIVMLLKEGFRVIALRIDVVTN